MARKITQVHFSYAQDGGMAVRYEDGSQEWLTFAQIEKAYGPGHCSVLFKIAYHGGMTGMWYNARNGGNVDGSGTMVYYRRADSDRHIPQGQATGRDERRGGNRAGPAQRREGAGGRVIMFTTTGTLKIDVVPCWLGSANLPGGDAVAAGTEVLVEQISDGLYKAIGGPLDGVTINASMLCFDIPTETSDGKCN